MSDRAPEKLATGDGVASPLTLGTAGHIDHGKTALIKALTGVDTDRLPEERARGISIALGYASLTLPSNRTLSVIDVPGHERFVRPMVAGATGIDLYLMTVAADDGVMPQTREHAAVLQALSVETGVVAITKSDLGDPELAMIEASELLPAAEVVAVSARTGEGLRELLAALERAGSAVRSRAEQAADARLHIDRAFSIRGAGTVITGTLWSGSVGAGDELELLPGGRHVRVRAVQVHDRTVDRAAAGQRVAVNLVGVPVSEVARGDVLSARGAALAPTFLIDTQLALESEEGDAVVEHGDRLQIHHGTREAPARLAWLGGSFWQIRLEGPLVAAAGDRLVVRQIAPPDTLGGGVVLDPHPRKHGPSRALLIRLERLARGEPPGDADDRPRAAAPPGADRPATPQAAPQPPPLSAEALAIEQRLRDARFEPPLDSELDPRALAALRADGRAVRVSKTLHYHPDTLAEVRRRVTELAGRRGGAVTLADLRDDLGTSRKFAQALLEHLDAERVTIRRGDEHVLRRRALPTTPEAAGRGAP
jgi:selenocysteine-specific elongation factor